MNISVDPSLLKIDLQRALQNNEFYMEYQPKINLSEGKIAGSEALIRWKHPKYGNVSPAKFIPLAAQYNLNEEILQFVINSVCKQVKQWEIEGVPGVNVSFNLSPKSFTNPSLVDTIKYIFNKHNVSPKRFEIEITEEALLQNTCIVHDQFIHLKELGFNFALDDLGKGYSSFSTLTEFPFDTVKIDRSYIRHIDCSQDTRYIVKSFIEISKRIGKKVVAEGVETEAQLRILNELNCDEIQGFYFSPSISSVEMATWYKKTNVMI